MASCLLNYRPAQVTATSLPLDKARSIPPPIRSVAVGFVEELDFPDYVSLFHTSSAFYDMTGLLSGFFILRLLIS